MEPSNTEKCTCSKYGYARDCPLTFQQGGKLLHAINDEMQLKPRVYESPDNADQVIAATAMEREFKSEPKMFELVREQKLNQKSVDYRRLEEPIGMIAESEMMYDEVISVMPKPLARSFTAPESSAKKAWKTEEDLMSNNRAPMQRFQPLEFMGTSLQGYTIGGYGIDLREAARKVSEIAPLPRSRLPVIFVGDKMNFYHHFYQGLDILLGQDMVESIVNTDKFYRDGSFFLMPMIKLLIKVGYERSDNEITILVKKVINSTFNLEEHAGKEDDQTRLFVASNLYGFPYIEDGMEMKEEDLKMWLQSGYSDFRIEWFNTFKSSGIPKFALEGVQTRYEGGTQVRSGRSELPGPSSGESSRKLETKAIEYDPAVVSRSSAPRRKHHNRPRESSVAAFLLGK